VHAGRFGDEADGFVEGPAHRGADQAAAELIGPAAGRERELGVEGVHARRARGAVADPADADLSEEGEDPSCSAPPPFQPDRAVETVHDDDRADIAAAPCVEVGL